MRVKLVYDELISWLIPFPWREPQSPNPVPALAPILSFSLRVVKAKSQRISKKISTYHSLVDVRTGKVI